MRWSRGTYKTNRTGLFYISGYHKFFFAYLMSYISQGVKGRSGLGLGVKLRVGLGVGLGNGVG